MKYRTSSIFIAIITNLSFILLLSIVGITNAQSISGEATYTIKLAEDFIYFDSKLQFTESSSLFASKQRNTSRWFKQTGGELGPSQIVYTDTIGHVVWRNFFEKELQVRLFCEEGQPIVYKDVMQPEWSLENEKKELLGLTCHQATTTFRGRDYIAWYAPSIPTSAGPWKFFGLPGLIVKITDKKKEVSITLKKLNIQAEELELENPIREKSTFMDRLEVYKCLDKEWEKFYLKNRANIAKLQAEFPNLEIDDNNLPRKRPATEIE